MINSQHLDWFALFFCMKEWGMIDYSKKEIVAEPIDIFQILVIKCSCSKKLLQQGEIQSQNVHHGSIIGQSILGWRDTDIFSTSK